MSKRNFYKTIIQVEVLSEELYNPESLDQVAYDIVEGDCSGTFKTMKSKKLNGKETVKELQNQGSDPEFFQLDENGNDIE